MPEGDWLSDLVKKAREHVVAHPGSGRPADIAVNGDPRATLDGYRAAFLVAVARWRPHVLASLADEPYRRYRALLAALPALDPSALLVRDMDDWPPSIPLPPLDLYASFEGALAGWAFSVRLVNGWCVRTAHATLWRWRLDGRPSGHADTAAWAETPMAWQPVPPMPYAAHAFPVFRPSIDERNPYRDQAISAFAADLDRHIAEMEAWWASHGQPARMTKEAETPHFDWLARWQVPLDNGRHEGYARIEPDRHHNTVKDGIRSTATLIGLTLRPARPGRPRNN